MQLLVENEATSNVATTWADTGNTSMHQSLFEMQQYGVFCDVTVVDEKGDRENGGGRATGEGGGREIATGEEGVGRKGLRER